MTDVPERPGDDREAIRRLLREFAASPSESPERAELRDALVREYRPIVEYAARRFQGRGEPRADLIQVGCIGLINSLDRFQPERGLEFTFYAMPTIVGEIKRHFRDKGWMVAFPSTGGVEYREALRPLLASLGPRERAILVLRFFHHRTQTEIAAEVGLSQMHVSRLLARTLAELRIGLSAD